MSDVIGRGVIEVSADSTKLNAAISEARARLKGLGDAGKDSAAKAAASIDKYVRNLENQNATLGKSKREIELYKLALRGASDAQLKAANAALAAREAFEKNAQAAKDAAEKVAKAQQAAADKSERFHEKLTTGLRTIAAAAAAAAVAGAHFFGEFISQAADFQDMAEKTGESAENLASLFVSAKVGGLEMDGVADAIVKLNNNLSGVDDESKAAGAALKALGLNINDIKAMSGADQLEAIGKAFNGFEESSAKATVATALFSKSGKEMLSFLKELGSEGGRQKVLTNEQIAQADEYADKLAKQKAVLSLYASELATKLLPTITEFTKSLGEIAKNEDSMDAITTVLKGTLVGAITVFQTFAIVGSEVAFTFRTLARDMDGFKRQAAALQNLDFKKVREIGLEVVEADAKDRTRLDKLQAAVMAIKVPEIGSKPKEPPKEQPKPQADYQPPKPDAKGAKGGKGGKGGKGVKLGPNGLPYIDFTPPDPAAAAEAKAAAAKAAQEAKEQVALDVEIIRQGSEQILNTYQNADRILQSRRQNQIISETEYYEGKAGLIRLDAAEQERALKAEIARYEQENLSGKERLANEKKIEQARGKLAKVRENEAIALDLNAADQVASINKIKQAYLDAAQAAQAYIDTIKRQNARIVEGVGKGQKFRERQDGANAIEDKLIDRKGELDADLRRKDITPEQYSVYLQVARETYAEEIRLFNERTDAIQAKQADGINGMTEALHNYADAARDIAGQTEQALSGALSGLEDAFVQLATTGKASFKDLLQSISADIARIGFRSLIGKGIDSLFGSGEKGSGAKSAAELLGGATKAVGGAGEVSSQAAQTAALAASKLALDAQAIAATSAKSSIEALGIAADNAALSLGGRPGRVSLDASLPGAPAARRAPGAEAPADAAESAQDQAKAQGEAAASASQFGSEAISAANDVARLAQMAGIGGDAMARLPAIISMIQAAAAANTASSAASNGAGIFAKIAGLFGGGGGVASSAEYAASDWLAAAEGGYIKGPGTGTSDSIPARLSNGEYVMPARQTAAFLPLLEQMRGDDLRHTSRAGVSAIARIMAESRRSGKEGGTLPALAGGRAIGGPVSAGGLYRVNEKGPELLSVAGKEYLMLGQHGGSVSPAAAPTRGGDTVLNVTVAAPAGASRATALQFGAAAGRQIQHAMRRNG